MRAYRPWYIWREDAESRYITEVAFVYGMDHVSALTVRESSLDHRTPDTELSRVLSELFNIDLPEIDNSNRTLLTADHFGKIRTDVELWAWCDTQQTARGDG